MIRSPVAASTKWILWSYPPVMTHVRPSRSMTVGCPVQPLPHHVSNSPALMLVVPHISPFFGNAQSLVGLDRNAGPVP